MIYNKLNLSITDFCKEESRQEISGVFFTPDKTVATDSYILIEVERPEINIDDFPMLEREEMKDDYIIPVKAVKKINANIPTNKDLPIIENAVFVKSKSGNGHLPTVAEFATTDLEQTNKVQTKIIEGKYPEYEGIFPTGKEDYSIKFNPKYLKKLCDFWIKNGKDSMEMKFYNEKPTVIKDEFDGQKVKAMIMSIKEE